MRPYTLSKPRIARTVHLDTLFDEASEHELLASLLAYSQSSMCVEVLLQHFHSIGHVLSAEPAQLQEFGVTDRDMQLLRLVREAACRMAAGSVRSRPTLSKLASANRLLSDRHGLIEPPR